MIPPLDWTVLSVHRDFGWTLAGGGLVDDLLEIVTVTVILVGLIWFESGWYTAECTQKGRNRKRTKKGVELEVEERQINRQTDIQYWSKGVLAL